MSGESAAPTSGDIAEVINAVAQLGLLVVAGLGVWVAYSQLKANRIERHRQRRAELAEEMIVTALQALDAFKHMRNPLDSVPEDKANDREFAYRKRYERVVESNDLFLKLRDLQFRFDAVAGEPLTASNVSALFNARSEIVFSIQELSMNSGKDRSEVDRSAENEALRVLYGSWSERDKLGQVIQAAVTGIVSTVSPYAAFNEARS